MMFSPLRGAATNRIPARPFARPCVTPGCERRTVAICDAPTSASTVCDARMCDVHRTRVNNLDYCPSCVEAASP